MPTVLSDKLPALEPTTSSDIVRTNLEAIHSARKNYIAAENSERIRRALRHQVRTFSDVKYETGDRVYYKRKNVKGWKGPAVVLGQDGKFVLVRHGGAYYRVHPCQLLHVQKMDQPSDCVVQKSVSVSPTKSAHAVASVFVSESDDSERK